MKRRDTYIVGIALLIVLAVANFLASRHFARVDLTAHRQFSLAPSTKELLRGLDDLVTIRVYFTRQMPPALLPLKQAVDDLLAEYHSYAGHKIQFEYLDPQSSPQVEQEVQILGISPVQLNVVAKDKREIARVYLGMVIFHGDKKHVIPVVDRPDNLEYEMTAGILRVTQERPPVIGWWGPEPGPEAAGDQSVLGQYGLVRRRLEQRYTVKTVPTDGAIVTTDTLQALVLVAPRDFTSAQQSVIDRYLTAGGRVVALIDRVAVQPNLRSAPVATGLESLFGTYGVTVNQDLVADASNTYAAFGGGGMTIYRPYPFWVVLHRQNFATEHPIVARLEQLTLPWVSSLAVASQLPEGLSAVALARSSSQSGVTTGAPPFDIDPESGLSLLPAAPSPSLPVAVLLTGRFPSVLAAGQSPTSDGQLFIVGTSRMIEDRSAQQFPDGVIFFENALDYLAMGEQLIGIRSRAVQARPIVGLSDGARTLIKYANTFCIPLFLIAAGLIGVARRRARRRVLQMAYGLSP